MSTKGTIQVEFQQVINQANALENCADELQQLRGQIDTLVDTLRGGWAGESAELYFQKCSELSRKLNKSRQNLNQTAGVIRKTAKAYRDAELAAIQLVQN